eukprot:14640378-Heterocapsa_arctica.AAC.1
MGRSAVWLHWRYTNTRAPGASGGPGPWERLSAPTMGSRRAVRWPTGCSMFTSSRPWWDRRHTSLDTSLPDKGGTSLSPLPPGTVWIRSLRIPCHAPEAAPSTGQRELRKKSTCGKNAGLRNHLFP